MSYILFTAGSVLIFISLILTYRVDNKQEEDFYLEPELLSELRELKDKVDDKLANGQQNFEESLAREQENQGISRELTSLREIIEKLTDEVAEVEAKLVTLQNQVSTYQQEGTKQKVDDGSQQPAFKPEEYKKIKQLNEEGLSSTEIARELDMGAREVDLIWKLNSQGEE
jgi:DNA-binding NarL/FixJ family response regulator